MKSTIRSLSSLLLMLSVLALIAACTPSGGGLKPAPGSTGNPPLIPHEVSEADGSSFCLDCHASGEGGATKVPEWHATLVDCVQCHVHPDDSAGDFKTSY